MKRLIAKLKKRVNISSRKLRGFNLVEAVLAMAVLSFMVMALGGGLAYAVQNTTLPSDRQRALLLAQEGIDATRFLRNVNYSNLVNGAHGLSINGGTNQWQFTGTSDVTDTKYTRVITISTIDANTQNISSNVSWVDKYGATKNVTLVERMTNIARTVALVGSWANPAVQSSLDLTGVANATDIAYSGNYAYLLRPGTGDLVVIDITNLAAPSLVTTFDIVGDATSIRVAGNYAYISSTNDTGELAIVNISNPAIPALTATVNLTSAEDPTRIFYVSNKVYLARLTSTDREFYVIDVTTPASPSTLGSFEVGFDVNDVYVNGTKAYITTTPNTTEMIILDVTTPASITQVSTLNLTGNQDGFSINGFSNTVLVTQTNGDMHAVDVTNALTPTVLGTYTGTVIINKIALGNSNNYAFLAGGAGSTEFRVVNIQNPASMTLLGSANLAGEAFGVVYDSLRDRAYVADAGNTEELIIMQPL